MPKIKRTYAAPRARSAGRADSPVVGQTPPEVAAPIFAAPQVTGAARPGGGHAEADRALLSATSANSPAYSPAVAAPHRFTDYDVDKLVFWVCVCLFAFAFAVVK
jgi:hypothetical protein